MAVRPPVVPMLGRLARELPVGGFVYEPKWDGFRCLAFCSAVEVDLRSRHDRPLSRYFPELVEALRELDEPVVLDGEIVAEGFDFEALLARLHPAASRVERLRRERPAHFIAFDLLARGEEDLRDKPFSERRTALEAVLATARAPLHLTAATEDAELARGWLREYRGRGIDGVMAKSRKLLYEPGGRAMTKVKLEQTADCVIAGCRALQTRPVVGSLLLGLYDAGGELRHIGVAGSFSEVRRRELAEVLRPLEVPLAGHPWQNGFLLGGNPMGRLAGAASSWSPDTMTLDWVPLEPRLVCEVAFDHAEDGRLRHPARFRRWRPDRGPRSCLLEQLDVAGREPEEALWTSR